MFVRNSFIMSSLLVASLMMSGCCCGPGAGGCGNGYGTCVTNCNDCDGGSCNGGQMAYGPLQHLTQMRKSLVCGGGCGEVYYGEWQSTPPDANDPCCNDQFTGGAVPCQPFCWRPGTLFGIFGGLYGQRFCEGCGNSFDQCGCGFGSSCGGSCGDGCGCDSGGYESGGVVGSGTGCSTCSSSSAASPSNHRIANPNIKTNQRTAQTNRHRSANARGISGRYSDSQTRYR